MATFSFEIHKCSPGPPMYNTVLTDMEGWKTHGRLKSTHPKRTWQIEIRGQTFTEQALIIAHWDGQGGATIPFSWTVRPMFFTNGVDTTYFVRYKDISYVNPDGIGNIWNFTINFVEEL